MAELIDLIEKKPPSCQGCTPYFDEEKAKDMSVSEIKQNYPRFCGICSVCGFHGISYASYSHYIAGDW